MRNLMNESHIRNVIEAALLAAGKPLQPAELVELFDEGARPPIQDINAALVALMAEYSDRGIEVKETAAGFRIQVRREMANEISRLWPERPARYSRALLETLALIAYRQPITRAEIEAVRGVAVNPNILKTVIERNWVRVVGHRDVPGRPELLGTTRDFLDYFGLKNLDELPPLAELKVIGDIKVQFDLPDPGPVALAEDANGAAGAAAAGVAVFGAGGAEGAGAGGAVATGDSAAAGAEVAVGSGEGAAAEAAVTGAEVSAAGSELASADAEGAAEVGADGSASSGAESAGRRTISSADADGLDAGTADDAAGVGDATPYGGGNPAHTGADGEVGAAIGDGRNAAATAGQVGHDAVVENAAGSDEVAGGHGGETTAGDRERKSTGNDKKSTTPRRGAPDSALHEAEEFAASIDADLAAGEDDGSDDDELSASGPGSSELVAGPRDIDD
jgi:segregation and condensation protein B